MAEEDMTGRVVEPGGSDNRRTLGRTCMQMDGGIAAQNGSRSIIKRLRLFLLAVEVESHVKARGSVEHVVGLHDGRGMGKSRLLLLLYDLRALLGHRCGVHMILPGESVDSVVPKIQKNDISAGGLLYIYRL